jgi:hypothetical protein
MLYGDKLGLRRPAARRSVISVSGMAAGGQARPRQTKLLN